MNNQLASKAEAIRMLQERDINPTQQRIVIAQLLFARPQHMSAEQVLMNVQDSGVHVSKATVYNTLSLFAEKGLVKEVIVDPTKVFYDSNIVPHHHFFNIDNGQLSDIDDASLQLQAMPQLPDGTQLDGVDVIIRVRGQQQAQA
ncbi:MAG: transcriptional repressor [Gammaproteobacteria bacterium]|nr:transcriptional repressor [Gammaproteobacteria bacterium]